MGDQRNRNLLIIFAKYPEAGEVKTRLAKGVGEEKAAELYSKMVDYTIEVASQVGCDVELCYGDERRIGSWDNSVQKSTSQENGDLGHRMSQAFNVAFENNYEKVVLIGSDCMELTTEILKESFEALDYNELTIGPSHDGGYYLIGMTKYYPVLFEDMEWSTEEVLSDTMHRVKWIGVGVEFQETLSDVDNINDLKKVKWLNDLV